MNFSFLPEYWAYFNYGVIVTIMISVCVVFFWHDYWGFDHFCQA